MGNMTGDIRKELLEIGRLAEEYDDYLVKISLQLSHEIEKLDLSELTSDERNLLYLLAEAKKGFALAALRDATMMYLHAGVDPFMAEIEAETIVEIDKEAGYIKVGVRQTWPTELDEQES